MAKEILHAIDIKNVVSNSIAGIVLGSLLALIPASSIASLILVILGLMLIIVNGIKLYQSNINGEKNTNETILNALGILMGILLLTINNVIIIVIASIYLIVNPIIKLYLVKFDREKARIEVPKIALGLVLIVCGLSSLDILFKIIGIIVLVGSLLYLGFNYYLYKKSGVKIIK